MRVPSVTNPGCEMTELEMSVEQASGRGDGLTRTERIPEYGLAVLLGALDGAILGALANVRGWFLGGWLWPAGGAVLGGLLAFLMVRRRMGPVPLVRLIARFRVPLPLIRRVQLGVPIPWLRWAALPERWPWWYAARFAWMRVAALAWGLNALTDNDVLDTLASVSLAVALLVGYFVEANAFAGLAQRAFVIFAAISGALVGAVVGALANSGGWFLGGSLWPAGGAVLGVAVAVFWAGRASPSAVTRARITERMRPAIFLAPALIFISGALVIPTLRTIYLSFRGPDAEEVVGLENYRAIRDNPEVFDVEGFGDIWTGRLAVVGMSLLVVALVSFAARALVTKARSSRLAALWVTLIVVASAPIIGAAVWLLSLAVAGGLAAALAGVIAAGAGTAVTLEAAWPRLRPGRWKAIFNLALGAVGLGLLVSVAVAQEALGNSELFAAGAALLGVVVAIASGRWLVVRLGLGWSRPVPALALLVVTGGLVGLVVRSLALRLVDGWLPVTVISLTAVTVCVLAVAQAIASRTELDLGAPGPTLALTVAGVLVLLGGMSALTGVLWNNVFWIVFVGGLATVFGLAIAVLADRSRGEPIAKSLIFMPMAISFVGASVIWTFVYDRQPASEDQIGLLNALWVHFGGAPQTWLQDGPWNNMLLIVIMIWIQTGFAMVILSAAVKGVPEELREASRIDGATELQTFWRVTLPHIRSTIIVVVTTLIVTVLKIYDIVQVMTGGRFGTNVIANQMFDEVFQFRDFGRGSALAVLLFVAVLPLMVVNVRRLRSQEEVR